MVAPLKVEDGESRKANIGVPLKGLFGVCCGAFGSNFLFCSTGVFQVIIVQYLDYHGIQGGDTGLGVLSSYLGLLLFALPFMFDESDRRPRYHKMFIPTVLCDILGQICAQVSIQMCGSGLFMVIYSSITILQPFSGGTFSGNLSLKVSGAVYLLFPWG